MEAMGCKGLVEYLCFYHFILKGLSEEKLKQHNKFFMSWKVEEGSVEKAAHGEG